MRRHTKSPLDKDFLCNFLNKIWTEGWLDSFSEDHFLICAMKNHITEYHGKSQLQENNANLFNYEKNAGLNFAINFSNKLAHLCELFGK